MRYTVDENLHIRIYIDTQEEASIFQPYQPNTAQPWETTEQASAWAEEYIRIALTPPVEETIEEELVEGVIEETPIVE